MFARGTITGRVVHKGNDLWIVDYIGCFGREYEVTETLVDLLPGRDENRMVNCTCEAKNGKLIATVVSFVH